MLLRWGGHDGGAPGTPRRALRPRSTRHGGLAAGAGEERRTGIGEEAADQRNPSGAVLSFHVWKMI
jgi:hypothetical protein